VDMARCGTAGRPQYRQKWAREHGPIPAGLTVDHTCENRDCMNLSHMELVSRAENARRTHVRRPGYTAGGATWR